MKYKICVEADDPGIVTVFGWMGCTNPVSDMVKVWGYEKIADAIPGWAPPGIKFQRVTLVDTRCEKGYVSVSFVGFLWDESEKTMDKCGPSTHIRDPHRRTASWSPRTRRKIMTLEEIFAQRESPRMPAPLEDNPASPALTVEDMLSEQCEHDKHG